VPDLTANLQGFLLSTNVSPALGPAKVDMLLFIFLLAEMRLLVSTGIFAHMVSDRHPTRSDVLRFIRRILDATYWLVALALLFLLRAVGDGFV
jgi:hypothetical protein